MEGKIEKLENEISELKKQVKSLVAVVEELKPRAIKEKYINLKPDPNDERVIRFNNI